MADITSIPPPPWSLTTWRDSRRNLDNDLSEILFKSSVFAVARYRTPWLKMCWEKELALCSLRSKHTLMHSKCIYKYICQYLYAFDMFQIPAASCPLVVAVWGKYFIYFIFFVQKPTFFLPLLWWARSQGDLMWFHRMEVRWGLWCHQSPKISRWIAPCLGRKGAFEKRSGSRG